MDAIAAPAVEAVAGAAVGVLAAEVWDDAGLTDPFGEEQAANRASMKNRLGVFISMFSGW
jgi:hypothetical protein